MGTKEKRFINNNEIDIGQIMYITRVERKSVIHMSDGRLFTTFHTIKGLLETLPEESFSCINKGIVISYKYVKEVKNNTYTMTDGTIFKGRAHSTKNKSGQLQNTQSQINQQVSQLEVFETGSNHLNEKNNWQAYRILDELPLPFCVIELVFDEAGHGIDFIFRYCNKEMETLEGKTIEDMMNRSFYEVFENGDKKWLVTYADVAINGVKRVIESYSAEIDANLRIYCFQPKPNFCACVLIKI